MFAAQEEIYLPAIVAALRSVLQEADTLPLDWDRLFDDIEAATGEQFLRAWEDTGGEAMTTGQKAMLTDLNMGVAFDLPFPAAEDYLSSYGAKLVRRVNTATKDRIRTTLYDGMRQGKGVDALAADIRRIGRSFRVPKPQQHIRDRAELIAATELAFAYETAGFNTKKGLGIPLEKKWLAVNDARVDPICRGNMLRGWIDGEEPYGPVSHPPAHPACRCALEWRWPEDLRPRLDEHAIAKAKHQSWKKFQDVDSYEYGDSKAPSHVEGRDVALRHITARQGFGAKPHVINQAQMDAYTKAGETVWFRGIRGSGGRAHADLTNQFRTGNLYVGSGIWGNGTYVAAGPRGFKGPYYGETGGFVQGAGKSAFEVANQFSGGGLVMTGTLKANARVINWNDLESEWAKAVESWTGTGSGASLTPAQRTRAETGEEILVEGPSIYAELPAVLKDPGRYAAAQGYDAIYVPNSNRIGSAEAGDQYIILNRSAVRVLDTDLPSQDAY